MNKKTMTILGILMASIMFVSCKPISNDNSTPANPVVTSSAEPAEKGERVLRIAMNTERDSFDPYLSANSDTESIMLNVFEGLTGANEAGEIISSLAKSWDISEDGLMYTFYLNENVLFHDGTQLTSEDVEFSYKRLAGLDGGQGASSKFQDVLEVESADDYTVSITLSKSDAAFLPKCMVAVVPKDYTEQAILPIGTGPYKFVDFIPGRLMALTMYDGYYNDAKRGKIKDVEFVFMPDDNAKIMALRSGTIDMFEAAGEIIAQVSDDYNKFHSYSNVTQLLALNNKTEPFDDINVRRALNYAIDRAEIVTIVTGGNGTPIYTTFSPVTTWYDKSTENIYHYDVEKALQLLKDAGYENGFEMEITVPSNYQIHVNTAQVIANQLQKVGIKAVIKQVEMSQWQVEVYEDANYHTSIIGLTGKMDPHDVMIRFKTGYSRNFYNYSNPKYDALVDAGLLESNAVARKATYNEAQGLLTVEAASVFIQDPGRDIAAQADVFGFKAYPITFWDLSSLYFE